MKDNESSLSKLISTTLIVVLALLSFSLYQNDKKREKVLLTAFTDGRLAIVEKGLIGLSIQVEKEYPDLFIVCEEKSKYDSYINLDTRTMSDSELRDALRLHSLCGKLFSNKTNLTLGFFKIELNKLEQSANLLKEGKDKRNALQIIDFWYTLYDLEQEHGQIYERLIDIQEEYWEADLNKVTAKDTASMREEKVGTLNLEANDKLTRINQIQIEIDRFKVAESTYWKEHFATSSAEKSI